MDYTDLTSVKNAMDSEQSYKDTVLSDYITRASRTLDRIATSQPVGSDNYFMQEDIVDEFLSNAAIETGGILTVWPHKPVINSVLSMSYKYSLNASWITCDMTRVLAQQDAVIFEGACSWAERVYVQISYNGGLGKTVADLPKDFINVATVEAVRLYKEARAGMSDVVGVVELGTVTYTKAFPSQVLDMLNAGGYARTARWI